MGRLFAELNKENLDGWLFTYADINFLHFAIVLFLVCSTVLIGVSLLTQKPQTEKLAGLTFSTKEIDTKISINKIWKRKDLILSVLLIGCIVMIWIYFSG